MTVAQKQPPNSDPPALTQTEIQTLLLHADDAVLIGGAAIAFWAVHFNVPIEGGPRAFLSADADFLGLVHHVERFAKAIGHEPRYTSRHVVSALHGEVIKRTQEGEIQVVDVVAKVVGFEGDDVRRRAIKVPHPSDPARFFQVMHPIDCLVSRLENMRQIREKRNMIGQWQAGISVQVVRRYFEELLRDEEPGVESIAIRGATRVLRLGLNAAGRQAYEKYGIDVLDAIPLDSFRNQAFRAQQYTRVEKRIRVSRAQSPSPPKPPEN